MKHLRTHVLMLSVVIATALSVAVGVNAGTTAPEPEQSQFQAAALDIEPAPLPAVVDPAVRDEALGRQPDVTAVETEANARGLSAAVARAEQERQERERERQAAAAAERERQEREREQQAAAAPSGSVWDRLAQCESGGNWASTVGTYEGGLQFHPRTWDAHKPSGYPEAAYQASRSQQILVAERVLASQGWGAWPACSRKLGLR